MDLIPAVIYDFHGTLADVTTVLPLLGERRYDEFYEASLTCTANHTVVADVRRCLEDGNVPLLLTGMPEQYREGLRKWLRVNDVPIDYIAMRQPRDRHSKDFVVKERMYRELVDEGFYPRKAWEDSPGVIDLWKRFGIPVTEVPRVPVQKTADQVDTGSVPS